MRTNMRLFSLRAWLAVVTLTSARLAAQATQPADAGSLMRDVPVVVTLFQNVRIFDGKSGALSAPSNVLVRGNKIDRISADPIVLEPNANVHVIAGNGRVLMPGLIDAHWHAFMAATS